MKDKKRILSDALFTVLILLASFILNLILKSLFDTQSLIPMIFVLGVFLISWKTQGYFWGIAASLVSVLAVNYAFTFPFYAFDLISPECLASAFVMLVVSVLTGTLTIQIKHQEQIKAEVERERMRGNLLRAVSHDLRTPLTSISGASAVLLERYDLLTREQQEKLLNNIQEDSQWLIRMVENLLSVTRIDGEYVKLTKTDTVLDELIDAVLIKFSKRCPGQQVQVQLPDSFVCIPMDAMLIQQVLINILENAVDHAKGMKNLILSVTCKDGHARFRICDDGCGIDPERIDRLFKGFPDTHDSPSDGKRSNMGIGLSVCAAIIKAHGSEIFAANLKTGGAEFRFDLEMEDECEYE